MKRVQERIAQILREEPASEEECDRTDFAIGRAYEALGLAHLERDDISGARSKAERNLRLAIAVYEQINPKPDDAIARVEESCAIRGFSERLKSPKPSAAVAQHVS